MLFRSLKKSVEKAYYKYYTEPVKVTVPQTGTVQLNGNAETYWDKLNVFSIIAKVKGVIRITNNLSVKTETIPDEMIRSDIENQILSNRTISDPDKIKVKVTNGLVFLTGTVHFYHEAMVAEQVASWWKGVKSVDNQLDILPPSDAETDGNLADVVREVIKENFPQDSKNVEIHLSNLVLTLNGTVDTLWLKHAIEGEVHGIVGLKEVVNNLAVEPYMP